MNKQVANYRNIIIKLNNYIPRNIDSKFSYVLFIYIIILGVYESK